MSRTARHHAGYLYIFALLLVLATTACDVVENGSGTGIGTEPTPTVTTASFDPTTDAFDAFLAGGDQPLPLPSDLLFAGSTDGTLNLPISDPTSAIAAPVSAVNTLDGFSPVAPITVPFSGDIDTATLDGHLLVIDVTAPGGVPGAHFGSRPTVTASFDTDTHRLTLTPATPLNEASRYLVVVSGDLLDTAGERVAPSTTFTFTKATAPLFEGDAAAPTAVRSAILQAQIAAGLVDAEGLANLEALRQAYQAVYGLLEETLPGAGAIASAISRDDVVVAFTYTTQTVTAQAQALQAAVAGLEASSGLTVSAVFNPLVLAGQLPDVSSLQAVVTGTFSSADFRTNPATGSFITATGSRSLTTAAGTAEPAVQSTADLQFTLFLPKGVEPAPVVVFQHGITADRSSAFAAANTLASVGYATIAIDLPLHGSRTPDPVDDTGAPVDVMMPIAPGVSVVPLFVDAANSGVSTSGPFINLLSLLTTRDSVRQGWADLWQLVDAIQASAGGLDVDTPTANPAAWSGDGTADLTADGMVFIGHSLGSIVGVGFLAEEPAISRALLSSGGSLLANLLQGSPTFGPVIDAGLDAATGGTVVPGTAAYDLFFLLAQTVTDAGDPANVAAGVSQQLLLQEAVGDAVIPNLNTELLALHLGLPLLEPSAQNLLGLATLEVGTGLVGGSGLFQFGTADSPVGHAFLLRTEDTLPDGSMVINPVFQAQTQMATFVAGGTVVDPAP